MRKKPQILPKKADASCVRMCEAKHSCAGFFSPIFLCPPSQISVHLPSQRLLIQAGPILESPRLLFSLWP